MKSFYTTCILLILSQAALGNSAIPLSKLSLKGMSNITLAADTGTKQVKNKHILLPYYDALLLSYYKTANPDSLYSVLVLYDGGVGGRKPLDTMIKTNPFFPGNLKSALIAFVNHYSDSLQKAQAADTSGIKSTGISALSGGILPAIGGLDVTNVANGISQFMIKRAKEELTIAFFDRFQKFAQSHPEFEVLFPKTCDNLKTMLSYNYTQWLPALRTGFYADLQAIPANIDSTLSLTDVQTLLQPYPQIKVAIRMISLADTIKNGKLSIVDGIREFGSFREILNNGGDTSNAFRNFANSVRVMTILSEALRDSSKLQSSSGWITSKQLLAMDKDAAEFPIFLGLIYQQSLNMDVPITFYYKDKSNKVTSKAFSALLAQLAPTMTKISTLLEHFISITNDIDSIKNDIAANKTRHVKISNDDYYNYINTVFNIVDFGFDVGKQFDPNITMGIYDTVARKANEIYRNIYQEQYPQAILNVNFILNKVCGNSNKQIVKMSTDITTYGLFIADMIGAKTSDDVESIVENAVLPAGSSSIKKSTANNLSIQGYLGAYFSIHNNSGYAARSWSDGAGIFAPIGIAYTPGLTSWGKGGSLSLFVSVFDLGAVIDYKLKKDSTIVSSTNQTNSATATKSYTVNLGQIFSPGIHIVYGFFENLPISFGVGAQYGPGLSKIDANSVATVINPSWRFNAFLTVDLPFFTIINKPRTTN